MSMYLGSFYYGRGTKLDPKLLRDIKALVVERLSSTLSIAVVSLPHISHNHSCPAWKDMKDERF